VRVRASLAGVVRGVLPSTVSDVVAAGGCCLYTMSNVW